VASFIFCAYPFCFQAKQQPVATWVEQCFIYDGWSCTFNRKVASKLTECCKDSNEMESAALMEKGERNGGEIHSIPTGMQHTAICSGKTDWNNCKEGEYSVQGSFSTPFHLICHEVHGCSVQGEDQRKCQNMSSMSATSWLILGFMTYICEEDNWW